MEKNIVIVHYNTPKLTECLVRSINKYVEGAKIYIFDNSDKAPFTYQCDNLTIFDNTKGQIIDFDEFLERYPKRNASPGHVNDFGSAKHCYSIEKCIEIVGKNFILLDSDVLLKRDISELFDEDYIYVAQVDIQNNSTIKRVLPYICFINVEMCKENGIHYFDDAYMHGLCCTSKNKFSDRYDTGSGFYINASKKPHKEIRCSTYIKHYGHGSWTKKGYKVQMTQDEWLSFNKKLYTDMNNKKVIYTCITNGYDCLDEPNYVTDDFDYVCFTDNLGMESDIWEIRPLPKECDGLPSNKKQRMVKILPHLFLKEYDLSIWVDGNYEINGDLNEFLSENANDEECSVFIPTHPQRDCIYDEERAVHSLKKDTKENTRPQIDRYVSEGFPKHYGLVQSNIIVRRHNNEDCIKLMEKWFEELKNGSHRDQLSFNYACWKNEDVKVSFMRKDIYKSKWLKWGSTHRKSKNKVEAQLINMIEPSPFNAEAIKRRLMVRAQMRKKITNKPKRVNINYL